MSQKIQRTLKKMWDSTPKSKETPTRNKTTPTPTPLRTSARLKNQTGEMTASLDTIEDSTTTTKRKRTRKQAKLQENSSEENNNDSDYEEEKAISSPPVKRRRILHRQIPDSDEDEENKHPNIETAQYNFDILQMSRFDEKSENLTSEKSTNKEEEEEEEEEKEKLHKKSKKKEENNNTEDLIHMDQFARKSSGESVLIERKNYSDKKARAKYNKSAKECAAESGILEIDEADTNEVRYKDWYKNPKDKAGIAKGDIGYNPRTLHIPKNDLINLTPAQKQFWDIKSDHFDGVLFFKMGKFYELFFMDAELGHELCGLEWMRSKKDSIPHVGFPEQSFSKYADAFVNYGYKVYRIEQMETADEAKQRTNKCSALITREVCQVVTKSTLNATDEAIENALSSHETNYLISVCEEIKGGDCTFAVCFVDVSAAQFQVGYFIDDKSRTRLRTLFVQIRPSEILYNKEEMSTETLKLIKTELRDAPHIFTNNTTGGVWNPSQIRHAITTNTLYWPNAERVPLIFRNDKNNDIWNNDLAMQSVSNIIWYLKSLLLDTETLPNSEWKIYNALDDEACGVMMLDGATMTNLEILLNEDGHTKGSLFGFINKCHTDFGQRKLKEWVAAPLKDINLINERLDCVEYLMRGLENSGERDNSQYLYLQEIMTKMKSLPDLIRYLAKISALGTNRRMDRAVMFDDAWKARKVKIFCTCLDGLEIAYDIFQIFKKHSNSFSKVKLLKRLTDLGNEIPDFKETLDYFKNGFDMAEAKTTGFIRPRPKLNPEYDKCIASQESCQERLQEILEGYQRRYKDTNIKYHTQKGKARSYQVEIPKTTANKARIPEDWQETSSTVKVCRYRSPEVADEANLLWQLKDKEEMLLRDSARIVFASFAEHSTVWKQVANSLAELDCLMSLAHVSGLAPFEMSRPMFTELKDAPNQTPFLELRKARHPGLVDSENTMQTSQFIPNDTVMGCEENPANFVIVTGPNMGGKSTLLRQTCICMILAHMGCFVPSTLCRLTPIDRIFTRVGANDRILMGQSTFMVELEETSNILRHATGNSLVILDELGRGTSTHDGTAIAQSVAEYLIKNTQCRCLFSTHYHGICDAFENNEAVAMYHMSFAKEEGKDDITFLYEFTKGVCKESHGINCARLAGLQDTILNKAEMLSESLHITMHGNNANRDEHLSQKFKDMLSICGDWEWVS